MKNSKNLVIRFVFILTMASINTIIAQKYEYYPFEDTKSIIIASADNYFPKLNEPVKLKLKVMLPHDIGSENNIGFSVWIGAKDGMEILEGEQWNKKKYKKNQIVEMVITVKFTKKMYYQVKARFASRAFVLLPFYVGGAYIPSLQVQDIRKKIIELREQTIKHNKGNKITNRCALNDYPVRDGTKHIFSTTTEYEKTTLAIKKADKYNIQLFATFKKEYDSLSVIVEKLFNEDLKKERQKMRKERSKLNKTNKQNSDSINLQGVFEESSQNSSSPNENLGFDPMYAIKNHRSAGHYAIYNGNTGEYLSITNINVVPNTLGHTEFLTEHKKHFYFFANSNIASGTLQVTVSSGQTVSVPITVYGDFPFNINITDAGNFFVELWDKPFQSAKVKVAVGYLTNGAITFQNVNVDNYEVIVRAERPKVEIYDNRQNSNTGTIIFDKSDRNTSYCSQLLHNNSDVTFNDVAPTEISRLHTIVEAMELGYTFEYAISAPIRVLCTNSVPITGYGSPRWIDINAGPEYINTNLVI